jgi:hypothetical protein
MSKKYYRNRVAIEVEDEHIEAETLFKEAEYDSLMMVDEDSFVLVANDPEVFYEVPKPEQLRH